VEREKKSEEEEKRKGHVPSAQKKKKGGLAPTPDRRYEEKAKGLSDLFQRGVMFPK